MKIIPRLFVVTYLAAYAFLTTNLSYAQSSGVHIKFPRNGEIATDRVNLRAGRSLNYEVVGKLDTGDRVTVTGKTGGWYRIVPPKGTLFWVSHSHVSGGRVTCGRLNVRVGPSPRSTVMCQLRRGEEVKVRDERDGWVAIDPPPCAELWVSSELIDLAPEESEGAEIVEERPPDGEQEPAEEASPVEEKPLIPCAHEGRIEQNEIVILGTRFRLVRGFLLKRDVALLKSSTINLDYFNGDRVRVWGHEVSRAPSGLPVIEVKRLEVR